MSSVDRLAMIRAAIRSTPTGASTARGPPTASSTADDSRQPSETSNPVALEEPTLGLDSRECHRPLHIPVPDFSSAEHANSSREVDPGTVSARQACGSRLEDERWENDSNDSFDFMAIPSLPRSSQLSIEDSPLAGKGKGKSIDPNPFYDDDGPSVSSTFQLHAPSASRYAADNGTHPGDGGSGYFDFQPLLTDIERLPAYVRKLEEENARLRVELTREKASKAQTELALKHLIEARR
ncbi:hypothetical protein K488DRAFT_86534 [Vararia minispora EC-137]|uniref:Uncharacterized protein n=1 Tax=Vararia minispora EC-137 TaxID=1314806 RepID=A0ACB8QJC7_9AGAM|nr:hypothetical protein K488DRAFT_86534 [Vararia minispora EC-137]